MDFSELEGLSASLGRASSGLVSQSRAVIAKGALNIKNETRANISTHPTWKKLAHTVNYEQVGLSAEVGYDDRGQGELAGIAEFGSSRHAPHPALMPAAKAEAPKFEKAMLGLGVKALDL
jgi:hypothetical protein